MAKEPINMPKHRCSFCGKTQDQVRRIIAGPGAYICNECIALCQEILADDMDLMAAAPSMKEIPTPSEMKEVLDEYVIGQEKAKRTLCVAVYNHYKRIGAKLPKDAFAAWGTRRAMWSFKSPTSSCSAPPAAARPTWPRPWPRS